MTFVKSRKFALSRCHPFVATGTLLASIAPASAEAAIQQTRICVDLELGPGLWDASPRQAFTADYGEDYGRWEGAHPFPARRWLARVLDENGSPIWGYAPLDEDGCTGSTADVAYDDAVDELSLEIVDWAYFISGDRSIIGYDCSDLFSSHTCDFELSHVVVPQNAVASGTTWFSVSDVFGVQDLDYPVWAVTFCEERLPINTEFEAYILQDGEAELSSTSAASSALGGSATVTIVGTAYHQKFTACHEMGHLQTALLRGGLTEADVDTTYNPDDPLSPLSSQHSWEEEGASTEWQAAATLEGFGQFYALWAWNDIDSAGSVQLVYGGGEQNMIEVLDVPPDPSVCWEGGDPLDHLGPGVANEANWATALRAFRTDAATTPSAAVLFGMLGQAYDGGAAGWVATGQTSDFWDNFMDQMDGYLTSTQLDDWEDAAAAWCLDH